LFRESEAKLKDKSFIDVLLIKSICSILLENFIMKKLLTLIAVFALAAIPAVSQAVTLTVTDNGSGSVTISYAGASEGVVGVSMLVTLSSGDPNSSGDAVLALPTDAVSTGDFDAHIDHWNSNPGPVTLPDGNPVGDATAAGLPGASATSFAISTGRLGTAGTTSGDIATLQLTGTTCTTVTLSADTAARGGIVGASGATLTVASYGSVETCPVPPADCWTGDAASRIVWESVGSPDGWCVSNNARQCRGDADGLSQGKAGYWVSTDDLDVMVAAWNQNFAAIDGQTEAGTPLINADYDHLAQGKASYRVSTDDLDILVANWNDGGTPADCTDF
jgi:hypothetical protein